MIRIVMQEKNISLNEAISYSVNQNIYKRIIDTGWGEIALSLWGHGGPARRRKKISDPQIEIDLDESRLNAVYEIEKLYKIDAETAIYSIFIFR
ncbi:MAG: hypothetical protein FWG61_04955 [Firmicutes bacterium]|nr:hypothetical protein [Bacillota bacterium]